MSNVNRLSISTVAFLIGLGSSPVLAQTAKDTTSVSSSTAASTPSTTQTLNQNVNNDSLNSRAIDRMVDQDLESQQEQDRARPEGWSVDQRRGRKPGTGRKPHRQYGSEGPG